MIKFLSRVSPRSDAFNVAECEQFLVHEARLLDEARFDEWLRLFAPDGWYWVPSEPGQKSPHDTVSLIYDDRRLLETRVRRLGNPDALSQEPRSRTTRMLANVTIEDPGTGACTVRSKFQLLEFRGETQRVFGGTCLHRLVRGADEIMIAWKRVDLLNCDAPHEGLSVPF